MKKMKTVFSMALLSCSLLVSAASGAKINKNLSKEIQKKIDQAIKTEEDTEAIIIPFSNHTGFLKNNINIYHKIESSDSMHYYEPGKPSDSVHVIFFSTNWCPNCPTVASRLDECADKLKNSDKIKFLYVTIVMDKENTNSASHSKIKNMKGCKPLHISKISGIESVPTCVVFNKKGRQVFKYSGATHYNSEHFTKFLLSLAKQI